MNKSHYRDNSATIGSVQLAELRERGLSLRILKEGKILIENEREGMKPLLGVIRSFGRSELRRTMVVDKIVGKAAALLIGYFRPKIVYSGMLSRRAETILQRYRIAYYAERVVPEILCKTGDDLCPFEKTVLEIEAPLEGYRRLVLKALNLKNSRP